MLEAIFLLNVTFIFGCIVGSFLGVVVDRMYREEQFVSGGSYCEKCKKPLQWYDMIPVLSFLVLRGKCRYCHTRLSSFLPIIELTTGLIFAILFYLCFVDFNENLIFTFSAVTKFLYLLITFALLEIIFFMDAKYMAIPMIPLYIVGLLFVLYSAWQGELFPGLDYRLYAAFAMFIFFAGLHYFSKGRMMGDGDIYLAVILGFILGLDLSVVMWFLSFMLGSLYAIYLMLMYKAGLKQQVPFGPFLILGFILSYACGNLFLSFYYSLI